MLPTAGKYEDKICIMKDMLKILKEYEKVRNYDELFLNAHYLLLDIVHDAQGCSSEEVMNDLGSIRTCIEDLKDCEAKMLVLNHFEI